MRSLLRLGHSAEFAGYRSVTKEFSDISRVLGTRSDFARNTVLLPYLRRMQSDLEERLNKDRKDLILVIKGEMTSARMIRYLRAKYGGRYVLWYPDDPRYFRSFAAKIAPAFDHVFTSSERAIPYYRAVGVTKVSSLKFACDPQIHRVRRLSQDEKGRLESDVCLIGTYYPRRARILRKLKGRNVRIWGPGWRLLGRGLKVSGPIWGPMLVKAFNAAKIVLNIHHETDLRFKVTMRVFEATGSRALLLTDRAYGIEECYDVGRELICYDNEDELVELVDYFCDSPSQKAEIAARGQERAYREHTYDHRLQALLSTAI